MLRLLLALVDRDGWTSHLRQAHSILVSLVFYATSVSRDFVFDEAVIGLKGAVR